MSTATTNQLAAITLECSAFRYTLGANGQNLGFFDLGTGVDYLDHTNPSACAYAVSGENTYPAAAVTMDSGVMTIRFAGIPLKVNLEVSVHDRYMVVQVLSAEGADFDRLVFLNIPLTLHGHISEPFGACALALNPFTHVHELPTVQSRLEAACYPRFGVLGAKSALLGAPPSEMLPLLREVVGSAPELPSLRNAGAWAQGIPFNHGSYLFNFGTLTADTVEEWIDMVRSLGFDQIDNHGGSRFFKFGALELDRAKWPEGWDTFKRIVARLHAAGIDSILHTYSFFIDKHCEFVTPVPSQHLDAFRTFTLARDISPDDTTIYVNESTADMSTITGFVIANSITLHIGDELVNFGGVSKEPPYAFTNCVRGAFDTQAAAHAAGSAARHLKEYYGLFVPDCESPLFGEIARRHAEIVDHCDFDGMYFDAIDGSHILRGREDGWYWGQQFVFLIYQQMKKRVSMEMSAMWHQMWNLRSRYRAWDYPVRGYKRFIDLHLDEVTAQLQLPLQLGWWNFHYAQPPQIESHSMDVLDYLGSRLIGYNAGISLTGAVNRESLREVPLFRRLVERLRLYEDLRKSGYFTPSIRTQLCTPGQEFELFQNDGRWQFRPVCAPQHLVDCAQEWTTRWTVDNPYSAQAPVIRVAALMSAGEYYAPSSLTLADLTNTTLGSVTSASGITLTLEPDDDRARADLPSVRLTAANDGTCAANAAWARYEVAFEPWLNLEQQQAIGVWVRGDGSGALLNIRLASPVHIAMGAIADHYVILDFSGWRYCRLVESESSRWSDYQWGDHSHYYSAYRETIDYKAVSRLTVWLNGIAKGTTVSCALSPVRAVAMLPVECSHPTLMLNSEPVELPVTFHSGDYAELTADGSGVLYGCRGDVLSEFKLTQALPQLHAGKSAVALRCPAAAGAVPRLNVTLVARGEPLE